MKELKVTRELVKRWADMIDTDPHRCTESTLVGILIAIGVEIKEEK